MQFKTFKTLKVGYQKTNRCKLILLFMYKHYRLRLDYKREEPTEGWWRTVTKIKAWKINPYVVFDVSAPNTKTYFDKTIIH